MAKDREFYLPYLLGEKGMWLVDAAQFEVVKPGIPGPVMKYAITYRVPPPESSSRLATPHAVLFLQGSRWNRVWLEKSRSQAPSPIGPAITETVCYRQLIYRDMSDPDTAQLHYSSAGVNGVCNDADDGRHMLPMDATGATAPTDFDGEVVDQIHGASGALKGLVVTRNGSLLVVEQPSGIETVLIGNLSSKPYELQRAPDGLWIQIGRDWRLVSIPAALSPVRYTIAPGFERYTGHVSDSEFIYFLDTGTVSGNGTPTRVWRLRLDGSADAEVIHESTDEPITYVSNTDGRIWLSKATSPRKLWWMDKNNLAAGPQLAEEFEGEIAYAPAGDQIALSLQPNGGPFSVKVVSDTGAVPLNRNNAQEQFLSKTDFPAFFSLGSRAASSFVVLAEGGSKTDVASNLIGADFVTYDLKSYVGTKMFTFDRAMFVSGYGYGLAGLGVYDVYNYPDPDVRGDLFAYDVEDGRIKFFAHTVEEEEPIQ